MGTSEQEEQHVVPLICASAYDLYENTTGCDLCSKHYDDKLHNEKTKPEQPKPIEHNNGMAINILAEKDNKSCSPPLHTLKKKEKQRQNKNTINSHIKQCSDFDVFMFHKTHVNEGDKNHLQQLSVGFPTAYAGDRLKENLSTSFPPQCTSNNNCISNSSQYCSPSSSSTSFSLIVSENGLNPLPSPSQNSSVEEERQEVISNVVVSPSVACATSLSQQLLSTDTSEKCQHFNESSKEIPCSESSIIKDEINDDSIILLQLNEQQCESVLNSKIILEQGLHYKSNNNNDIQLSSMSQTSLSPKINKDRCFKCNKKITLIGFQCRCNYYFCGTHRHACTHDCPFDYKTYDRQQLSKANQRVVATKLNRI